MIDCRAPKNKQEIEEYYQLRWLVLRKPWKQSKGSEQDELELQAIHRCAFDANKNIVAVGRLHFIEQFHSQIRYMAVDPDVHGNGYGQQVLKTLEQEAAIRGAKKISLHARENAVTFYQHHGYSLVEKSHLLYGDIQHFLMEKQLSTAINHQALLANKLQTTWHQTIPLSQAMNIVINHYDKQRLFTSCEPGFNKNLHNTMFAGSIYTLATLTGWGWVYCLLAQEQVDGDIVLADAKIKYLAPIAGVVSAQTNENCIEGNVAPLKESKKSRVTVEVVLYSGDKVAAQFTGHYVILPKKLNKE